MKRFALLSLLGVAALAAGAIAQTTTKPAAGANKAAPKAGKMPHIRVDKKNMTVEMDARVVLNEGLLELLVCIVGGKDHEAILTTDAKPSVIRTLMRNMIIRAMRA